MSVVTSCTDCSVISNSSNFTKVGLGKGRDFLVGFQGFFRIFHVNCTDCMMTLSTWYENLKLFCIIIFDEKLFFYFKNHRCTPQNTTRNFQINIFHQLNNYSKTGRQTYTSYLEVNGPGTQTPVTYLYNPWGARPFHTKTGRKSLFSCIFMFKTTSIHTPGYLDEYLW